MVYLIEAGFGDMVNVIHWFYSSKAWSERYSSPLCFTVIRRAPHEFKIACLEVSFPLLHCIVTNIIYLCPVKFNSLLLY